MVNRELIRLKLVQLVYAHYKNEDRAIADTQKELELSLSKVYVLYNYLLTILVELGDYANEKLERQEAKAERLQAFFIEDQVKALANNKFLNQLRENIELIENRSNLKELWDDEDNFIRNLYKKIVDSEIFNTYLAHENKTYIEDKELIRKIYKTFICHNDDLDGRLEEHSLYWNDDKYIVDSFVIKTINRFEEKNGEKQLLLPEYGTEDDHQFAIDLLQTTLTNSNLFEELISSTAKNWDFSRMAFLDIIIMKIALAEILFFPSIPLNVTFNKYLNIAKVYSTPKSASYINGMLDKIVKKLKKEKKLIK